MDQSSVPEDGQLEQGHADVEAVARLAEVGCAGVCVNLHSDLCDRKYESGQEMNQCLLPAACRLSQL